MLITELKSRETIESLADGQKVFIINCLWGVKKFISRKRSSKPAKGTGCKRRGDRDSHHRLHM